jgi:hypothetical protein
VEALEQFLTAALSKEKFKIKRLLSPRMKKRSRFQSVKEIQWLKIPNIYEGAPSLELGWSSSREMEDFPERGIERSLGWNCLQQQVQKYDYRIVQRIWTQEGVEESGEGPRPGLCGRLAVLARTNFY